MAFGVDDQNAGSVLAQIRQRNLLDQIDASAPGPTGTLAAYRQSLASAPVGPAPAPAPAPVVAGPPVASAAPDARPQQSSRPTIPAPAEPAASDVDEEASRLARRDGESREDFYRRLEISQMSAPMAGLYGAGHQAASIAAGAGAVVADAVGADDTKEWFIKHYRQGQENAAPYSEGRPVELGDIDSVGDAAGFAGYHLGAAVPFLAETLVGAVIGGAVGSAAGPGGTIGGAAVGAIARKARNEGIKGAINRMTARHISRELGDTAVDTLTDEARDAVVRRAAKKTAGDIGALTGAFATSYQMGLGEIYGTTLGEDETDGNAGMAALLAGPYAALELIPELGVAKRLMGRAVGERVQNAGMRMLMEGVKAGAKEGATEAAQEMINIGADMMDNNAVYTGGQIMSRLGTAFAAGGVVGGGMGAVGGVRQTEVATPEEQAQQLESGITSAKQIAEFAESAARAIAAEPDPARQAKLQEAAAQTIADTVEEGKQQLMIIEGEAGERRETTTVDMDTARLGKDLQLQRVRQAREPVDEARAKAEQAMNWLNEQAAEVERQRQSGEISAEVAGRRFVAIQARMDMLRRERKGGGLAVPVGEAQSGDVMQDLQRMQRRARSAPRSEAGPAPLDVGDAEQAAARPSFSVVEPIEPVEPGRQLQPAGLAGMDRLRKERKGGGLAVPVGEAQSGDVMQDLQRMQRRARSAPRSEAGPAPLDVGDAEQAAARPSFSVVEPIEPVEPGRQLQPAGLADRTQDAIDAARDDLWQSEQDLADAIEDLRKSNLEGALQAKLGEALAVARSQQANKEQRSAAYDAAFQADQQERKEQRSAAYDAAFQAAEQEKQAQIDAAYERYSGRKAKVTAKQIERQYDQVQEALRRMQGSASLLDDYDAGLGFDANLREDGRPLRFGADSRLTGARGKVAFGGSGLAEETGPVAFGGSGLAEETGPVAFGSQQLGEDPEAPAVPPVDDTTEDDATAQPEPGDTTPPPAPTGNPGAAQTPDAAAQADTGTEPAAGARSLTANNHPEVAVPTPLRSMMIEVTTASGKKKVRVKEYALPNYRGPALGVHKYKLRGRDGYRIYLLEGGSLVEDSNAAVDLETTLKTAVQRISGAINRGVISLQPANAQTGVAGTTSGSNTQTAGTPAADAAQADTGTEPAAASVRRGEVGGKLSAGEVVLTASGRKTTPFPKLTSGSERKSANTLRRVDNWLLKNAALEAESRGDDFNARVFRAALAEKNKTQADKDSAEEYLFGEQPDVVRPITRTLVADDQPNQTQGPVPDQQTGSAVPEPAPLPATQPMDQQEGPPQSGTPTPGSDVVVSQPQVDEAAGAVEPADVDAEGAEEAAQGDNDSDSPADTVRFSIDPSAKLKAAPANGMQAAPHQSAQDVVAALKATRLVPTSVITGILGDFPGYLQGVADFMLEQREKLRSGTLTARDVAKAYFLTIASMGSGAQSVAVTERRAGMTFDPLFISDGKVRPEEAAAAWLFTPDGQTALDAIERGEFDAAAWEKGAAVRRAYGDDRLKTLNVFGDPGKNVNLRNLSEVVDAINDAGKRGDMGAVQRAAARLNGIGTGKIGFIKHLLGLGDTPTIDAVEVNVWLTGKGDTRQAKGAKAKLARAVKDFSGDNRVSGEIARKIQNRINELRLSGLGVSLDKNVAAHIIHHWLWDRAKGIETTHAGMYEAMRRASRDPIIDPSAKLKAAPARGMQAARLQAEADSYARSLLGPAADLVRVRVVQNQDERMGPASRDKYGIVNGYFDGQSGEVVLVADNIPNMRKFRRVMRHEAVAHFGWSALTDADKAELAKRIQSAARVNEALRGLWDHEYADYTDSLDALVEEGLLTAEQAADQARTDAVVAEEIFARVTEDVADGFTGRAQAAWDRVLTFLRDVLAKMGLVSPETTPAEMRVLARRMVKGMREGRMARGEGGKRFAFGSHVTPEMDREYMAAVKRGDMETAQRMVEEAAEEARKYGVETFTEDEANSKVAKVRRGPTPKKTAKAYRKVAFKDGVTYSNFVESGSPFPMGVWADGQAPQKYIGLRISGPAGKEKVNGVGPYALTGKQKRPDGKAGKSTGSIIGFRESLIQQGLKSGVISEEDAAAVRKSREMLLEVGGLANENSHGTMVAYRPGIHGVSLPYFPQGGRSDPLYDKNNPTDDHPYRNKFDDNEAIVEVEFMLDTDYSKDPRFRPYPKGLEDFPTDGGYEFQTNNSLPNNSLETWYISGAVKHLRILSREETDQLMRENGMRPQKWINGEPNWEEMGVKPGVIQAKKLLDPITYDDNGNVIPLSRRFNPRSRDPRFSITKQAGDAEQLPDAIDVDGAERPDIRFSLAGDVRSLLHRKGANSNDPYTRQNARIKEQDQTLAHKAKLALRRALFPGGNLPRQAFDTKIVRDNELGVTEMDTRSILAHFEDAFKAEYGKPARKATQQEIDTLNAALRTTGDLGSLKPQTKARVLAMREYISHFSERIASLLERQIADLERKAVGMTSEEAEALLLSGSDVPEAQRLQAVAVKKKGTLEAIRDNMDEYVHRSYQAFDDKNWYKRVPAEALNNARAFIAQERELYAQELDERSQMASADGDADKAAALRERAADLRDPQRIENELNAILKAGTAYSDVISFLGESKLGAMDLTIFRKRKDIPVEIRELWGEHKDPRLNFARTVAKQSRFVENQLFLERIKEIGEGEWLFERRDDAFGATAQIPSSDSYSPIEGMWTTPEIAQAFEDATGRENLPDWYRAAVRVNGAIKWGKTIGSPTTQARNFMSAAFFAIANGHFNFRHGATAWKAFGEYLHSKDEGKFYAYLRKLKKLGVVYDAPYAEELKKLLDDSEIADTLASGSRAEFSKWTNLFQRVYSYSDDFWKLIGFENEKALLMNHKGMSEADAEVAAAERIRNTYPTYSMTGRFVNQLRRFPLAGTFVSFPAEIIRTTYHILNYAAQDMKDPALRPLAVRRLIGIAMASSAIGAAQAIMMAALNVDDEEEEAFRELAAPWQRNSNIMPIYRASDGRLSFVDMSFLDPYNYWKRPINAIMRDEPWESKAAEVAREVLSPFFGTDILFGAIVESATNKKESGGRVFNPHDTVIAQTADIVDHMRKAVQPGAASLIERTYMAASGKISSSGKEYSMPEEAAGAVGFRITTFDPKVALYYKTFEFQDAKRDATSILNSVMRDPNPKSERQIRDALRRSLRARRKAYRDMTTLVQAAQRSGLSRRATIAALRNSGVPQRDIQPLLNGTMPQWQFPRQAMRNADRKARLLFSDEVARDIQERGNVLRRAAP